MLARANLANSITRGSTVAEMTSRLIDLLAKPVVSAFESGTLLCLLREQQSYREESLTSFEDVLRYVSEITGKKRSSLYDNMRIAERFDVHAHGHLGIAKLRLLVKGDRQQALQLIEDGIEIVDPTNGGRMHRPIKDLTYRDLRDYLKGNPLNPDNSESDGELADAIASLRLESPSMPVVFNLD